MPLSDKKNQSINLLKKSDSFHKTAFAMSEYIKNML
jgi:hypothetical protein